ncbi:MAG: adenosylmethionine-8-amino-7-oxononanoate aminotransferase [Gemmatimonadetes bacterium]|nr:adenosylmethionine-8-amino-7-oxononanoate aminotransferase [Gemmatimonadota bacterium]
MRGEGCYLWDDQGQRYLDGSGGAFVANIGHGVREIADAIAAQAARIAYLSGAAFTSPPVEALATELAALTPGDLNHIYFLSSGSEAVEAALKLARQYWVESGRPEKQDIISLSPGYHGNTLLAMSASARPHYATFFREWIVDVHRVPAPLAFYCACRGADASCEVCSGTVLEKKILEVGADRIAAFIAEPVGGSSTGATVPRQDYWRTVRDICDRHEVLFIADEVACGAGRTGTWSALEPYGVVPDIMTMGKGIAGGYTPLSAVAAPRRIVDVIARGSGALAHAQTFSHHPVLCAAGLATLRYLREHALVARAATMGRVFHDKLSALLDLPHVGDVRGRGMLAGIDFVLDRDTRTPFPRKAKVAERFTDAALLAGLMVWPNVGHANGVDGDIIMLAPPFIIEASQIDELVTRFRTAYDASVAGALATT